MSIQIFCPFVFFVLSCKSSLCIMGRYKFCKYFLPACGLSFYCLTSVFWALKDLNFEAFLSYLRNLGINQALRYSPTFSFFFANGWSIVSGPFVEKIFFFTYWIALAPLSKQSQSYMYVSNCRQCSIFIHTHTHTHTSFCKCHTVLNE